MNFSTWSIHHKLIMAFLLITVLPLVTLSYFIEIDLTGQNERSVTATTLGELVQIDKTITMFLDDVKDNVSDLVNQPQLKNVDNTVTSYLDKDDRLPVIPMKPAVRGSLEAGIYDQFLRFMISHPKIGFMAMGVQGNGGYIQCPATTRRAGYDPRERDWYKLAAAHRGEVVITDPYYEPNDAAMEVSFVKAVLDDTGMLKGVVSLDMTLAGLSELIKEYRIGKNGYIILTDKNGTILANPIHSAMNGQNMKKLLSGLDDSDQNHFRVFENKLDGGIKAFFVYTSPRSFWKIIGVVDKAEIVAGALRLKNRILLFALGIMILAVITGIFMARRITGPIRKVVAVAEAIARGDLAAPHQFQLQETDNTNSTDEIGILERSIIHMAAEIERNFRKLEESMRAIREKDRQVHRAEIKALQAQIRPHFFFNALNTIACYCRIDPDKAQQLLAQMGIYLRGCFNLGEELIPLSKELEFCQAYLALEQARMGARLRVVLEVADCHECVVPPLLIQPLVENAVRHGLFPKVAGGTVTLTCRRQDDDYVIQVTDDGVGMTPEKAAALLQGAPGPERGIGVRNVAARLQSLFGSELKIISFEDDGTQISFTIPGPCRMAQLTSPIGKAQ